MNSERVKLIAAACILIAAGGVYFFVGSEEAPFPNRVAFVCVATGERYDLSSDQLGAIPETNPDTNEHTLLPIQEIDGRVYVTERHSGALADELKEVNRFVDPKTLEVRSEPLP